jgi:hypothetical protein
MDIGSLRDQIANDLAEQLGYTCVKRGAYYRWRSDSDGTVFSIDIIDRCAFIAVTSYTTGKVALADPDLLTKIQEALADPRNQ